MVNYDNLKYATMCLKIILDMWRKMTILTTCFIVEYRSVMERRVAIVKCRIHRAKITQILSVICYYLKSTKTSFKNSCLFVCLFVFFSSTYPSKRRELVKLSVVILHGQRLRCSRRWINLNNNDKKENIENCTLSKPVLLTIKT